MGGLNLEKFDAAMGMNIASSPTEPTMQDIWKKLSRVDVRKHVEKKNGLSYLSWAWAWGELMEHYPEATYDFPPERVHEDGTVTVYCNIRIGRNVRTMWLPVMNYKNEAVARPDARKLSDTKMRCLVKCISMFGLGHFIYAGEDLPIGAEALKDNSGRVDTSGVDPVLAEKYAEQMYESVTTGNRSLAIEIHDEMNDGEGAIYQAALDAYKVMCKKRSLSWGRRKFDDLRNGEAA